MNPIAITLIIILTCVLIYGIITCLIQDRKRFLEELEASPEETRHEMKNTRSRKIGWIIFFICISCFGIVRVIGSYLERDVTTRLYNFSPKIIEKIADTDTLRHKVATFPQDGCFVFLNDGTRSLLTSQQFLMIKDRLFEQEPDAFVLCLSLPNAYTWEHKSFMISAPLLGVSIKLSKDEEHLFSGDAWGHKKEIEADYRSEDIKGSFHKIKLGGKNALTVFDEYKSEKRAITYYDSYTDFFHNGNRYTLTISSDKQHFGGAHKFKKLVNNILQGVDIYEE